MEFFGCIVFAGVLHILNAHSQIYEDFPWLFLVSVWQEDLSLDYKNIISFTLLITLVLLFSLFSNIQSNISSTCLDILNNVKIQSFSPKV